MREESCLEEAMRMSNKEKSRSSSLLRRRMLDTKDTEYGDPS